MKFFPIKKNKGFTLVETLVGLLIFSFSVIAMMSVLGNGISDTRHAQQKIMAGYLAQEGIEYARNVRDAYVLYPAFTGKTWSGGEDNFVQLADKDITPADPLDPAFTRAVTMRTFTNPDVVLITSEVTWGDESVIFSEYLYNWVE